MPRVKIDQLVHIQPDILERDAIRVARIREAGGERNPKNQLIFLR
jgi:hypothetical protein